MNYLLKRKGVLFTLLIGISGNTILGQSVGYLDVNHISAPINSDGLLFWDTINDSHFEVPKGSGKSTIFSANYWLGGLDDLGNLHLAAQTYRIDGNDFRPGPYNNSSMTPPGMNRVWKVSKAEIFYHIQNYSSPTYQIPDAILNWPGNGDTLNGESWQLAPYYDFNQNGIYEPHLGDCPKIRGHQAVFIIISDQTPQTHPHIGSNLDIEMHVMFYAYQGVSSYQYLDSVVFSNIKVFNRSSRNYSDFYFGHNVDFDIGYFNDDYTGCDVGRNMFYGFNGDNDDEGPNGYGLKPPFQIVKFLRGPLAPLNDGIDNNNNGVVDESSETFGMTNYVAYRNDFTILGNPVLAQDYYGYMRSVWKDGTQIVRNGTNGHQPSGGLGPLTNFLYPSNTDPNFPGQSWSEQTAGNTPGERRGVGSFGPFFFSQGSQFEVDMAYMYIRTNSNSYNFELMGYHADMIQNLFDSGGATISIDENDDLNLNLRIYPNPTRSVIYIETINIALPLEYEILDLAGRSVFNGTLHSERETVDLSHLSAGVYILRTKLKGLQQLILIE
jgi:hypothetical protein